MLTSYDHALRAVAIEKQLAYQRRAALARLLKDLRHSRSDAR